MDVYISSTSQRALSSSTERSIENEEIWFDDSRTTTNSSLLSYNILINRDFIDFIDLAGLNFDSI